MIEITVVTGALLTLLAMAVAVYREEVARKKAVEQADVFRRNAQYAEERAKIVDQALREASQELEEKRMKKQGLPLRRFEFRQGRSNKYWEAWTESSIAVTHWGRMGTDGQFQRKNFSNNFSAEAYVRKMVNDKLAKGYKEVFPVPGKTVTADAFVPVLPDVAKTVEQTPDIKLERIEPVHVEEKQKRAFKF